MKLHAVLIGTFCGCLLGSAGADAAQADTPQLAVGRMAAAYNSLDLTNYMAVYARSFTRTSVAGGHFTYLSLQAATARQFAGQTHASLQCRLLSLTIKGNTAQGTLVEHYALHQTRHTPGYIFTQDVTSAVSWVNSLHGWQLASAQMSRDATLYQRP